MVENWKKSDIFTLIILKNIYFIALLVKRALKWYIFHQILIILKIPVIFQCKTSNGTALYEKFGIFHENLIYFKRISLKSSNIMKAHEISKKHTERYSIQVKELVFSSKFSKISKFPVIFRTISLENLLDWLKIWPGKNQFGDISHRYTKW